MKRLRSDFSSIFSFSAADQKLGQPVPESNFVSDENSGAPHPEQIYIRCSLLWRYFPVKRRAVAFFLTTWTVSVSSCFFYSSSEFLILARGRLRSILRI